MSRSGLALAYFLATLLAQAAHDHGYRTGNDHSRAESLGGHARTDLVGHLTVGRVHIPANCSTCQFRADHQAWPLPTPSLILAVADQPPEPPGPTTHPGSILRAACRAPPRA